MSHIDDAPNECNDFAHVDADKDLQRHEDPNVYRLNAEPNFYGCHDPQCLDSTWDHECPVTPGMNNDS